MSFDPYPPPQQLPGPEGPLPDDWGRQLARERVVMPATLMVGVGLLNLLVALFVGGTAVYVSAQSADRFAETARRSYEENPWLDAETKKKVLEELARRTPDQLKRESMVQSWVATGVLLLSCVLSVVGGVQMMRLRQYGLAVLGAVVLAIPCISPCACCGLGELTGLWALYVLLNAEVRAAFP